MTPRICLITPISRHPRYVYHPRFFVLAGAIIERGGMGPEALSLDDAMRVGTELELAEARQWLNGEIAAANLTAMYREELRAAAHEVLNGRERVS